MKAFPLLRLGRLVPRLVISGLQVTAVAVLLLFPLVVFAEGTESVRNWQTGFSAPASPLARQAFGFYNNLLFPVVAAICLFVFLLGGFICWRFAEKRNATPSKMTHHKQLEVIWTLAPVAILAILFVPSLNLMRAVEDVSEAAFTVKATGHQWYWSYEYPDHEGLTFDSNLLKGDDLKDKTKRLLQTDNALVLPVGQKVRVVVTATDVLHSWSVPRFGVKIDAVPGRLNETWLIAEQKGTYYGFCTELCGAGHAYMPVEVQIVSKVEFAIWLRKAKKRFVLNADHRQKRLEHKPKPKLEGDLRVARTHN